MSKNWYQGSLDNAPAHKSKLGKYFLSKRGYCGPLILLTLQISPPFPCDLCDGTAIKEEYRKKFRGGFIKECK